MVCKRYFKFHQIWIKLLFLKEDKSNQSGTFSKKTRPSALSNEPKISSLTLQIKKLQRFQMWKKILTYLCTLNNNKSITSANRKTSNRSTCTSIFGLPAGGALLLQVLRYFSLLAHHKRLDVLQERTADLKISNILVVFEPNDPLTTCNFQGIVYYFQYLSLRVSGFVVVEVFLQTKRHYNIRKTKFFHGENKNIIAGKPPEKMGEGEIFC